MTFEEFKTEVFQAVSQCRHEYRLGQAIFNYIDETYGVARDVQFIEGIDCFYDDEQIIPFIYYCWVELNR